MRRYPQFHSSPERVSALPSVGAAVEAQTVARRRYPQFGMTPNMVATLPSLGSAEAPAFEPAWAANCNTVIA